MLAGFMTTIDGDDSPHHELVGAEGDDEYSFVMDVSSRVSHWEVFCSFL
jgi:hypothetical protein